MDYLDKRITGNPTAVKKEVVLNDKDTIKRADNIFYIEDESLGGWLSWGIGILLILGWIFIIWGASFWSKIIITLVMALPGLLCIIYGFIAENREMKFDRINGKMVTPGFIWVKSKKLAFNEGHGVVKSYLSGDILRTTLFFQTQKGIKGSISLSDHDREDFWNFTVWYMDKNRPLPPGNAFDEFRQQDFEHRKSRGFPKPLYPSDIKTPEATTVQQAERKKIGGW